MNKSLLIIVSTLLATSSYASNPDTQSVKPFQVAVADSSTSEMMKTRLMRNRVGRNNNMLNNNLGGESKGKMAIEKLRVMRGMNQDQRSAINSYLQEGSISNGDLRKLTSTMSREQQKMFFNSALGQKMMNSTMNKNRPLLRNAPRKGVTNMYLR